MVDGPAEWWGVVSTLVDRRVALKRHGKGPGLPRVLARGSKRLVFKCCVGAAGRLRVWTVTSTSARRG
eukprot:7234471-Pyramimonas_sp.AAC.1